MALGAALPNRAVRGRTALHRVVFCRDGCWSNAVEGVAMALVVALPNTAVRGRPALHRVVP